MDYGLIPADPALVRRVIARTFLASPSVEARLGSIRLQPHQVDAAGRLLALLNERNGAVLADATGLGKTYVAIALASTFSPALVVAPAALRSMWRESLGRCGVAADFMSYEALSRGALPTRRRLLILDEAHHARNPASRRYAGLADLAWGARVLLLSATPIHNRNRDVRALIALFIGSRAYGMTDREIGDFVVRREQGSRVPLPGIGRPQWLAIPSCRAILDAITALPQVVPASDGGSARALLTLGLIRAWASSDHALRETLRRRLRRVAAFTAAVDSGQRPDRRTIARWPVLGDSVQLGFPGLHATMDDDVQQLRHDLDAHAEGVRSLLALLESTASAADLARRAALVSVRRWHREVPIVAFTQFADTAHMIFRGCMAAGGVALVTGRGARIASGSVSPDEIVHRFDIDGVPRARSMPLDLLVATDVLSEGLSLRRAGVLVHLDLPWTAARLEQRVGRLRRYGSPHRSIAMYAIGPPVGARELVHAIRALQRKVRLSSGIVGTAALEATIPLVGSRMSRAVACRSGSSQGLEAIRECLKRWVDGSVDARQVIASKPVAVALVGVGDTTRLVAVVGSRVTEDAHDLLDALLVLSASTRRTQDESFAMPILHAWMERQRGRLLACVATDAPSPVHAEVLRRLQLLLHTAPRAGRASLGARVGRCRELVLAATGTGAEAALQRLLDQAGDCSLDALEQVLEARVSIKTAHTKVDIIAVLATDDSRIATSQW